MLEKNCGGVRVVNERVSDLNIKPIRELRLWENKYKQSESESEEGRSSVKEIKSYLKCGLPWM